MKSKFRRLFQTVRRAMNSATKAGAAIAPSMGPEFDAALDVTKHERSCEECLKKLRCSDREDLWAHFEAVCREIVVNGRKPSKRDAPD